MMMTSTFANKKEGNGKRYTIDGNNVTPEGGHSAWFKKDGSQLRATSDNPNYEDTSNPIFEISGSEVRPTTFHPNGYTSASWFTIS